MDDVLKFVFLFLMLFLVIRFGVESDKYLEEKDLIEWVR